MNLRQLTYFVAVAEELSFTRAAERLMMSQPPLSIQIQELERELSVELLRRDKRSVKLTPAGNELYKRAIVILRDVERTADRVRRTAEGLQGELRLGFLTSTTGPVLSSVMRRFRELFPDVHIELWELSPSELVRQLTSGRLDLIVARPDPELNTAGMATQHFYRDPLVLTVPEDHPAAELDSTDLSTLEIGCLISLGDDMSRHFNELVIKALSEAGLNAPGKRLEVRSMTAMLWAISLGFGAGFLTEQTRDLTWKGVRYVTLSNEGFEVETLLAWNPKSAPPTVENFLAIAEEFQAAVE